MAAITIAADGKPKALLGVAVKEGEARAALDWRGLERSDDTGRVRPLIEEDDEQRA